MRILLALGLAAAAFGNTRAVIVSDIGNEPDDQMSLTRLLVYSNEIEIEALIASTSTWQKTAVHPETMRALIEAYGQVRPNLLQHAQGWPAAEELLRRVYSGPRGYGMAGIAPESLSEGAAALIRAADKDDARPLWICIWGGAHTLAEALGRVRSTRSAAALDAFVKSCASIPSPIRTMRGRGSGASFLGFFTSCSRRAPIAASIITPPGRASAGTFIIATARART